METIMKRATAYKICIKDINDGEYIRSEQNPSFLLTKDGRKVSRVNLIAVLVEKIAESIWLLEDESGRIALRSFEKMPNGFDNGDLILVIGKPREISNEKYLIPEIIKKLDSYSWLKLRGIELNRVSDKKISYNENSKVEVVKDEKLSVVDEVYNTIKDLDKGEGVDFSILAEKFGNKNEDVISKLLEQGEIFEIKPGKLKVL